PRRAGNFLFAGSKRKSPKKKSLFIWPNTLVTKSSPLTQTDDSGPSPRPSFALRASYSLQAGCAARGTAGSANQEYDALKARLRRGAGSMTSVAASGELFAAKKFGQMKKALFFGDFLLSQQKKVTRPPGRDPAAAPARQRNPAGPPN